MYPFYLHKDRDSEYRSRCSSQNTLLDSAQELQTAESPKPSPTKPFKVAYPDPSQYTSFCDDIHRRFYATQRRRPTAIHRLSQNKPWQRDYPFPDPVHENGETSHGRISLPQENLAPTPPVLPLPAGFFSPLIAKRRNDVLWNYFKILSILWVFALAVLSLYWAVLVNVNENLEALKIAVVSFDGQFAPFEGTEPIVGNALIRATEHAYTLPNHLGWTTVSPSDFQNDPLEVRRWVNKLNGWGAIIVSNNASALLRRAIETGDPNYDPLGAAQIIYEQARDLETINQYVAPVLIELGKQVVADFGTQWAKQVLTNDSLSRVIYSHSPQALSPAIGFSVFNLRPFDPPTAIPAVTIGLIYLIIIAFFSFGFFLPIHIKFVAPGGVGPPLKFGHLVIWRWTATVFAYLCLSLAYSLVSRMFHIPFATSPAANEVDVFRNPTAFGVYTFLAYWMVNFAGMVALGLACENVGMVVGTPWVGLWLIFWVISNVATGFYALELAPTFFRWGYVWPLHSIVEASRTVLFDTSHMLGRDFGILLGWTAVHTVLFPFCCKIMRWKMIRAKKQAAAAAAVAELDVNWKV